MTTPRCVRKKELSEGKSAVIDCVYFSPRSHFVANGNMYCFLSDVTIIRVKWWKLERQEIRFVRIRIHLNEYVTLTKIRKTYPSVPISPYSYVCIHFRFTHEMTTKY